MIKLSARKKKRVINKKQKSMDENTLIQKEINVNRNAKDSVFCDLFGKPEYLIQLYRALHPEDTKTQENDLTIVTLTSVFLKGIYNDLGFMIGNRLIVLVEEQSTFAYNIIVRLLMYLAETYRRYIDRNNLNEYSTTRLELPRPEFYMVYTGEKGRHPDWISFRKDIPGMEECPVDLEVKVIYDSEEGDILNQYIIFSKVFTEQYKIYGKSQKTIDETFRICRDKDVLQEYLKQEEVAAIMYKFMDQETAMKKALRTERQEGWQEGHQEGRQEGWQEGRQKGRQEGEADGMLKTLAGLVKEGILTVADAAQRTGLTPSEFQSRSAALIGKK
ncbi:MAG: hypothetical protein IJ899_14625 [Blautia sp.]|nr:hypothetical protein [Blautia sp.]